MVWGFIVVSGGDCWCVCGNEEGTAELSKVGGSLTYHSLCSQKVHNWGSNDIRETIDILVPPTSQRKWKEEPGYIGKYSHIEGVHEGWEIHLPPHWAGSACLRKREDWTQWEKFWGQSLLSRAYYLACQDLHRPCVQENARFHFLSVPRTHLTSVVPQATGFPGLFRGQHFVSGQALTLHLTI